MLCMLGAVSASLGNTAAQVCHRRNVPVVSMQAFAMTYGSLLMTSAALVCRVPLVIDTSPGYLLSLFYLAAFGSVAAFMAYLTLLKNIGSDKAAYITLVSPIVALVVSTIFEGYTWSFPIAFGVGCIMAGNIIALRKSKVKSQVEVDSKNWE